MNPGTVQPPAGVGRRLVAAAYDGLLLVALWMLASLGVVALRGGGAVPAGQLGYQVLLLLLAALFFIPCWLQGGQTLGMRAWRLRVERRGGGPLDARLCALRFVCGLLSVATLGLGLLWLWLDREGLALHDRLAGTQVTLLPKEQP